MIKSCLITGWNGFLGRILIKNSEYNFTKIGRNSASDIKVDLVNEIPNINIGCDLVIHAAGKAHIVPKTDLEKDQFFKVNINTTLNLLKGLEKAPTLPKAFIFISSVAVYGLKKGVMISENEPLNAVDVYGRSKIEAENLIQNWCLKNKVICGILRLPLLAGPMPPGNLGAMIRGIKSGYYFNIERGKTRKSILLARDIVTVLDRVAEIGGIYNLTDQVHPSFEELSAKIASHFNLRKPLSLPIWFVKFFAFFGDLMGSNAPINSEKLQKIVSDLTFDDTKAKKFLNWNPKSVVNYITEIIPDIN